MRPVAPVTAIVLGVAFSMVVVVADAAIEEKIGAMERHCESEGAESNRKTVWSFIWICDVESCQNFKCQDFY